MIHVYIWIAVSAIGLLLSIALAYETRLDLRALGHRGNGRRMAATSRLVRECVRITVHGPYLLAGLAALGFLPREIIVPILIWGNAALVINSIIDSRTRPLMWRRRRGEPDIDPRDSSTGQEV